MSTPFDIVKCWNCSTEIYNGAHSCYSCGELSEWKKKLNESERVGHSEGERV